jgi:RNA polymerase sigma factor (sigma-70 family)
MVLMTSMAFPLRSSLPAAMAATPEPPLAIADAEARRLAAAVARGDELAFRQLYDRYHARLVRLMVVLSGGDQAVAHEVVQLVMLTAAKKLRRIESEDHLWHWLARVAHQHLAKARRHRHREPLLVSLAEVPEIVGAVDADAVLEESLDGALLMLDQDDRQTVEWFYFDGLSQKEIAERLATTPKAVSSRLERARAKLRSALTRVLSHET